MTWSNNLHAFYAFQIHWLSIINSVVLVFLLTGFVVIILVNTCRSLWYYCWLVHVCIDRDRGYTWLCQDMKCLLDCWTMRMSEYFSAKNTNLIWTCSICYLNTNGTTTLFCLLIFSVKGVFFMLQKQRWSFSVWGYFARKNQWGKQWWHRKMLAVFSGYLRNSV